MQFVRRGGDKWMNGINRKTAFFLQLNYKLKPLLIATFNDLIMSFKPLCVNLLWDK